jgi:RNase P/RNase MRP subunit POP5
MANPYGKKGTVRLTREQVKAIRAALAVGAKHQGLADAFGVHRTTITDIAGRTTWREAEAS